MNIDKTWLDAQTHSFGRHSLSIGSLLIALGFIGIAAPVLLSLATAALFAWLLILGGGFWGWHAYQHGTGIVDWLKAMLLLIVGVLVLVQPVIGIESLALLVSFYLLLDAFVSFSMIGKLRRTGGRTWMIFNGLINIALALLFLLNWPDSALWMVGLFVGISLLFDGWVLVRIGWSMRKAA
jgi:uncharacterized membrane protein HdeD (DUF308 family)